MARGRKKTNRGDNARSEDNPGTGSKRKRKGSQDLGGGTTTDGVVGGKTAANIAKRQRRENSAEEPGGAAISAPALEATVEAIAQRPKKERRTTRVMGGASAKRKRKRLRTDAKDGSPHEEVTPAAVPEASASAPDVDRNDAASGSAPATGTSSTQADQASTRGGKKRKSKAALRRERAATGQGAEESTSESQKRVASGAFCIKSSLGVPFLVVSNRQLVEGLAPPSAEEFGEILKLCANLLDQWEARGSTLLADFEGEFTGFEGELICGTFQRTLTLDPRGLRPITSAGLSKEVGLLVDLGVAESTAVAKRIMEQEKLTKAIWGADGDLTCLRFTPVRQPLGIDPVSVVDVQLGFSYPGQRLGMGRMLERVPRERIDKLPAKDAIDFDTSHSAHKRALPLPLSSKAAVYAVDDLHRVEAILLTQHPSSGNYINARDQTEAFLCRLRGNPAGVAAEKLQLYANMFPRKYGQPKVAIAVRVKRSLHALRHGVAVEAAKKFADFEAQVDEVLMGAGVRVSSDLTFAA